MKPDQGPSNKKPTNLVRIIKTPVRAVSKVLDLYVKGVSNIGNTNNTKKTNNKTNSKTTEAIVDPQHLPRSFSTSRISHNYEEPPPSALVRSISTAVTGGRTNQLNIPELEAYMAQQRRSKLQSYAASRRVPKSCGGVGLVIIDEDRASSFKNVKY